MIRRFTRQLAEASYKNNVIDPVIVTKISSYLSKKEIKEYIKQLKNVEKSNTIKIDLPQSNPAYVKELQNLFPNKKILTAIDPSLLLGMRIQNNDDVYEMSLKNTLDSLATHITENYD